LDKIILFIKRATIAVAALSGISFFVIAATTIGFENWLLNQPPSFVLKLYFFVLSVGASIAMFFVVPRQQNTHVHYMLLSTILFFLVLLQTSVPLAFVEFAFSHAKVSVDAILCLVPAVSVLLILASTVLLLRESRHARGEQIAALKKWCILLFAVPFLVAFCFTLIGLFDLEGSAGTFAVTIPAFVIFMPFVSAIMMISFHQMRLIEKILLRTSNS